MWRGLEVAIKTILFEGGADNAPPAAAASEAAIASTLVHANLVATYSHGLRGVGAPAERGEGELDVYRLYLVQVCPPPAAPGN